MKEYNMSINDSIFTSLPFVDFSMRIYYFFIYKPNLLLKNMKFFLFQYSIRVFVLINMDNMPTVNARLRVKRWKGEKVKWWKDERVKRWKGGRVKGWKGGRLKRWKVEKVKRWKGEKVKRWKGEKMKGWKVKGWKGEEVKRWKDERMKGWKGERMKGWKGEKMKRWKDEKMKRWKDGCAYQLVNSSTCLLNWCTHQQMNLKLLRNPTWCRTDGLDNEKQV